MLIAHEVVSFSNGNVCCGDAIWLLAHELILGLEFMAFCLLDSLGLIVLGFLLTCLSKRAYVLAFLAKDTVIEVLLDVYLVVLSGTSIGTTHVSRALTAAPSMGR